MEDAVQPRFQCQVQTFIACLFVTLLIRNLSFVGLHLSGDGYPGMAYIVFPGNVGTADALCDIQDRLRSH